MNINWFRDEDNLVYINAEKDLHRLEVQLRLPGLGEAATMLHENPTPEGLTLRLGLLQRIKRKPRRRKK